MNFEGVKQVIVISDTHLGCKYENIRYLQLIFEYAKKHGITIILHCGDLLNGINRNTDPLYSTFISQINHMLDNYPSDLFVTTYLLYGNHDESFMRSGFSLNEYLEERKDIQVIGSKYGTITINNRLISMIHANLFDDKLLEFEDKCSESSIKLYGHFHKYRYFSNVHSICMPPLCDISKEKGEKSGFMVLSFFEDEILANMYRFRNDKIFLTNCECIKTKQNDSIDKKLIKTL